MMTKAKTIAVMAALAATLLGNSTATANQDRYDAAEIKQSIIGKRIYLAVPFGGEFPLNYRANGQVDGSGEALGLGKLAKPSDTGRWWIDGDRLCQKFTSWYKGEPMCFELERISGNTLKWTRNNGQTGTARIGSSL